MHLEVLNKDQKVLLPLVAKFQKEYYMVGGTAIALHIGHRMSIDFDLFKKGKIRPKNIFSKFEDMNEIALVTLNRHGQLNLNCRNVKFTFFEFEYDILHLIIIEKSISIPTLLDLAAMKAFAMGMRSKWKDYLNLYFIIKNHLPIVEISRRAKELFKGMFNEKLFRSQLSYFDGINYDEQVEFMPGFEVSDENVKEYLIEACLTGF